MRSVRGTGLCPGVGSPDASEILQLPSVLSRAYSVLHLTLENAITAEWEAQIRASGTGAEAPGSGLCVQGRRGGQKTPRARKSILSLCKRRKTA